MSTVFDLPDLGEGLADAEIVSWHVSVGDNVVADQPLVSVETDKAVVEVPAPYSGLITKIYVKAGDTVDVGAPLVEFEEDQRSDAGAVVGDIQETGETIRSGDVPTPTDQTKVKAAPAVRALAGKLGVDLGIVQPSGPKGAVTKSDVERAAKVLAEAGPLEKIRGVRRAMAIRMAQSHAEVVPATIHDEVDVEAWNADANVTVRLARSIGYACGHEPALNAWFDAKEMGRRFNEKVDLGIAVNTEDGLFVPVLHDVSNRDDAGLRDGLERMKADVQARAIPAGELRGQTITLSNFGMMAGRHVAMVVVPPQVAIIGAGRIEARVVAYQGQPTIRKMLPLSLTFDHRAVTGIEAANFLAAMISNLKER
ncbi:MAG: branched-chain alpha-keto acid dehydrogenase subunit E2 [Rhodospirillaceae bacterium]|jgi:pyruvate dehydrogenase E2 component (dihydrolipoamide acetyltransferase)|nr:branched-chain alpha-keto acid dehydrogenase subunit E2 [Rhodospirillaceae bacterium]MDP6646084.1 dihydrolipoamide acetyltransferase family protein [Rhodospirillales bacterium]